MNNLSGAYNEVMEIMKVIRANIERERGEESRASLAKRAGVHYQTIYDVEEGNRKLSVDVLERIADALGVEPADLLKREAPEKKNVLSLRGVLDMYRNIPEKIVKELAEFRDEKDPVWTLIEGAIMTRKSELYPGNHHPERAKK